MCGHLADFPGRSREHAVAVEAFATFLAKVEDVYHEHRDAADTSLAEGDARDLPA